MIEDIKKKRSVTTQGFLIDRVLYVRNQDDYVPIPLTRRVQAAFAGGVLAALLGVAGLGAMIAAPSRASLGELQKRLAETRAALAASETRLAALADQRKTHDQQVAADIAALVDKLHGLQSKLGRVASRGGRKRNAPMPLQPQVDKVCRDLDVPSRPCASAALEARKKPKPASGHVSEALPAAAPPSKASSLVVSRKVAATDNGPLDDDATVPAKSGFRIGSLLRSLGMPIPDEGGPFMPPDRNKPVKLDAQMRKLLNSLPLTAPLVVFHERSPFGDRTDPINGRPSFHPGIDLAASYRSPVYNTAPGVVVHAGWEGAYGKMVEIDHGHGIHTRYAHLSRVMVNVGQRLTHRTEIGLLGSTGRSTGPHVHYEIDVNGEPVDPEKFLNVGKSLVHTAISGQP